MRFNFTPCIYPSSVDKTSLGSSTQWNRPRSDIEPISYICNCQNCFVFSVANTLAKMLRPNFLQRNDFPCHKCPLNEKRRLYQLFDTGDIGLMDKMSFRRGRARKRHGGGEADVK